MHTNTPSSTEKNPANPHARCMELFDYMAEKSALLEKKQPKNKVKAREFDASVQALDHRIRELYNTMSDDEKMYLDTYIENSVKLARIEHARRITTAEVDSTLAVRSTHSSKASEFFPRIAVATTSAATGTIVGGIAGIWAGLRNAGDVYNAIRFKKSA